MGKGSRGGGGLNVLYPEIMGGISRAHGVS